MDDFKVFITNLGKYNEGVLDWRMGHTSDHSR